MKGFFFEKNESLQRFTKIFLDECPCKDCAELIESFKKAKEDPQSNNKAIALYIALLPVAFLIIYMKMHKLMLGEQSLFWLLVRSLIAIFVS